MIALDMVIVEMVRVCAKMDIVEGIAVCQQINPANVLLNVFVDVSNNVHPFMTYKELTLLMIVTVNAHKLVFHNVWLENHQLVLMMVPLFQLNLLMFSKAEKRNK